VTCSPRLYCDTMNPQPWPLPEVNSLWEWDVGNAMSREIVRVIGVTFAPPTVLIGGSSDAQEVTLEEFNQKAVPMHLGRHKR
jgi:hypothetical protein